MRYFILIFAVVAVVGCSPTVEIANPIVEEAIREVLEKPTGKLTKADLEKVTMLDMCCSQLTDVKGLEKCTKLTFLVLGDNKLTDVKGLEKLIRLERLNLAHNQLTDLKGLEKLTRLKVLSLQNNPDLYKAQIDELQKALPSCEIRRIFTKPEAAKKSGVPVNTRPLKSIPTRKRPPQ